MIAGATIVGVGAAIAYCNPSVPNIISSTVGTIVLLNGTNKLVKSETRSDQCKAVCQMIFGSALMAMPWITSKYFSYSAQEIPQMTVPHNFGAEIIKDNPSKLLNCTDELQKNLNITGGWIATKDPVSNLPHDIYVREKQTFKAWQSYLNKALEVLPNNTETSKAWNCYDFAVNKNPIKNIPNPIPADWIWTTHVRTNNIGDLIPDPIPDPKEWMMLRLLGINTKNFFLHTLYNNACKPVMMFIDGDITPPYWAAVCGPK